MKLVRLSLILSLVTVLGIFSISSTSYGESYDIPDWIKNLAGMYFDDAIDSATFGTALDWLIENEIITATISESSITISASYYTFSNSTGAYLTNSTGTFVVLERTIPTGFSSYHTFSNSTGAYLTNSTGTFVVLDRSSQHTFSNSTGAYLTNSTGTFVVLDRSSYHTFSNSTGAYLTNSTGTYKISP